MRPPSLTIEIILFILVSSEPSLVSATLWKACRNAATKLISSLKSWNQMLSRNKKFSQFRIPLWCNDIKNTYRPVKRMLILFKCQTVWKSSSQKGWRHGRIKTQNIVAEPCEVTREMQVQTRYLFHPYQQYFSNAETQVLGRIWKLLLLDVTGRWVIGTAILEGKLVRVSKLKTHRFLEILQVTPAPETSSSYVPGEACLMQFQHAILATTRHAMAR